MQRYSERLDMRHKIGMHHRISLQRDLLELRDDYRNIWICIGCLVIAAQIIHYLLFQLSFLHPKYKYSMHVPFQK